MIFCHILFFKKPWFHEKFMKLWKHASYFSFESSSRQCKRVPRICRNPPKCGWTGDGNFRLFGYSQRLTRINLGRLAWQSTLRKYPKHRQKGGISELQCLPSSNTRKLK